MSVATGEVVARWDRSKGAVHGLPAEVQRGSAAAIHEDVDGRRLRVSIGSFFQSGPQAAALLVDAVRRAAPELADAGVVVDAYAGVGMFAACATTPRPTSSPSRPLGRRLPTPRRTSAIAAMSSSAARSEDGVRRPDLEVDVVIADPARSGLGAPGTAALAASRRPGARPRQLRSRLRSAVTPSCSTGPATGTSARR